MNLGAIHLTKQPTNKTFKHADKIIIFAYVLFCPTSTGSYFSPWKVHIKTNTHTKKLLHQSTSSPHFFIIMIIRVLPKGKAPECRLIIFFFCLWYMMIIVSHTDKPQSYDTMLQTSSKMSKENSCLFCVVSHKLYIIETFY